MSAWKGGKRETHHHSVNLHICQVESFLMSEGRHDKPWRLIQ
jgi:hypothetical protein